MSDDFLKRLMARTEQARNLNTGSPPVRQGEFLQGNADVTEDEAEEFEGLLDGGDQADIGDDTTQEAEEYPLQPQLGRVQRIPADQDMFAPAPARAYQSQQNGRTQPVFPTATPTQQGPRAVAPSMSSELPPLAERINHDTGRLRLRDLQQPEGGMRQQADDGDAQRSTEDGSAEVRIPMDGEQEGRRRPPMQQIILIVVVLAIAAIVLVPQFTRSGADGKTSTTPDVQQAAAQTAGMIAVQQATPVIIPDGSVLTPANRDVDMYREANNATAKIGQLPRSVVLPITGFSRNRAWVLVKLPVATDDGTTEVWVRMWTLLASEAQGLPEVSGP